MAGLPYNCRCFTVTGAIAGMPNPSATGNNGGSGGSGGSGGIVPGVRGACSQTPVLYSVPPMDVTQLATPVNPSALIGNGKQITLIGSPFTISESGCYTLYLQAGGGGGGGCAGYPATWTSSDGSLLISGLAPGGAGGGGGIGGFLMTSVFLNAGDVVTYTIGYGGASGQSNGNPGGIGQNGSIGTATIVSIARQGYEIYSFIAFPGEGGEGGKPGSAVYPNLVAGVNGVGGSPGGQTALAQVPGKCASISTSIKYTYTAYSAPGAANWFGVPGNGMTESYECGVATQIVNAVQPTGYGFGGNSSGYSANPINSTASPGGDGFFLLVKYS